MGRNTNGLRIMFISLAIALVVTTVVAVLTVVFGKPSRIAQTPDFYAAMFGGLGLIFGTSAAIGGAIATVRLAGTALALSQDQSQREQDQDQREVNDFLARHLDAAIETFIEVLIAMSQLFVRAIALDQRLEEEIKSSQSVPNGQTPMSPQVRAAASHMLEALASLRTSLLRVQRHWLAGQCFRTMLPKADSSLVTLAKQLQAHGFPPLETEISHTDITSLAQFIMTAEDRLATEDYTPFMMARGAAALADANDLSLHYTVFAGDLILFRADRSPNDPSKTVVASLGAAMLFDIYRSIPGEAELREQISLAYPKLGADIKRLPVSFRPAEIAGENLERAITRMRERQEKLFVVLG
jgi:hypothetical protein